MVFVVAGYQISENTELSKSMTTEEPVPVCEGLLTGLKVQ